jgi:hypothetical protein
MRFDFYERFGIIGFTKEESSHTAEFLHINDETSDFCDGSKSLDYDGTRNPDMDEPTYDNDGNQLTGFGSLDYLVNLIDWDKWATLNNITPEQASYLLFAIEPYRKDSKKTADAYEDIGMVAQYLANKSASWSLAQLVDEFGAESMNTRLVDAVKSVAANKQADDATHKNQVAHVEWLRETWMKEGRLGGADFFIRLKRYKNAVDSPIADHWTHSAKGAGAKVRLIDGTTKDITKKTILNMVSTFNKQSQKSLSIDKTA